ncbi:hypothetical protein J6590_051872 [Homalodisca vitripennis]|nr:hypothetical protein J6590_051872 [Homalodisca vitripennis]
MYARAKSETDRAIHYSTMRTIHHQCGIPEHSPARPLFSAGICYHYEFVVGINLNTAGPG